MRYYARAWNFGLAFEAKVAGELAAFLAGMDAEHDLFLSAYDDAGTVLGSITLDVSGGGERGAHLRWFVVSEAARGTGLGKLLMQKAIEHCDGHAGGHAWLTTFAGLDAARTLYDRHSFRLVSETAVDQWSGGVGEQLFERASGVATAAA